MLIFTRQPGRRANARFMPGCLVWSLLVSIGHTILLNLVIVKTQDEGEPRQAGLFLDCPPRLRPRPAPERTKELNPSRGPRTGPFRREARGLGGEDWSRCLHRICIQRPIASARPRAENRRAKGVSSDATSLLDDSKVRQALEERSVDGTRW
jgi:hypothetical protein